MSSQIGARFDAVVTGASVKGTFVRTLMTMTPPIEGMLVHSDRKLDVGDHLRVQLMRVDVDRGFIDFSSV
jgi:exoribonuclease R